MTEESLTSVEEYRVDYVRKAIEEHSYCSHCGARMAFYVEAMSYDKKTGEPILRVYWNCKNNNKMKNEWVDFVHDRLVLYAGATATEHKTILGQI